MSDTSPLASRLAYAAFISLVLLPKRVGVSCTANGVPYSASTTPSITITAEAVFAQAAKPINPNIAKIMRRFI